MFPRDVTGSPEFGDAGGGGVRAPRPSRLRVPAMLSPYIGIVVGAILLARIPETSFERFWWLAPVAAIVYLAGLAAAIASILRRQRHARQQSDFGAALEAKLASMLALSPGSRRDALEPLIPRLREVRLASERLSHDEGAVLRQTLAEIDASATVTAELWRTRRKWRRADALFTLGWLADERSIPALCEALNGPDPDLAYVAGQSLAEYDSALACGFLVDALRSRAITRPLAATLLESSRYADAPGLIAGAGGDGDPEVRSWVGYLIGRSSDARAHVWLAALAGDSDAKVRASAAEALAGFGDAATLGRLLADDDWLVRANAARSVGRAGLSELADRLPTLLHDRVWWVRQSATIALKQLGARSVTVVRPLLEDEDRFARNKAAEVLVEVGYVSEQIAALAGSDADSAEARRALAALARADARSSIEAGAGVHDAEIRDRLRELLDEVDGEDIRVFPGELARRRTRGEGS